MSGPPVEALILDAHPLITQTYSALLNYASKFYVTPSVYNEIKDENARRNLVLWKDHLALRHPKAESIKRVADFARLTGDYSVLSAQDIHIIALALELDIELTGNDEHIRKSPPKDKKPVAKEDVVKVDDDGWSTVPVKHAPPAEKKKRRRGGKKQREKREAALNVKEDQKVTEDNSKNEDTEKEISDAVSKVNLEDNSLITEEKSEQKTAEPDVLSEIKKETLDQDLDDEPSDGEWITSENLTEVIKKDKGLFEEDKFVAKTALSSQDFAVQNVAIQLGLKLMNTATGLQIKRIRTTMLRCHACFKLQTNMEAKHFCDYCGGATLLRCNVIVDAKTGELKPLLKKNFEWHTKGNVYSIASPLSKATQKKLGKGGFQHNKQSKNYKAYNDVPILRADQKEYEKALKNEEWAQRQSEKFLQNWVGGGSADNFYSPFAVGESSNRLHTSVRVGKGRHVNAPKKK